MTSIEIVEANMHLVHMFKTTENIQQMADDGFETQCVIMFIYVSYKCDIYA